jgi:hypothetical protein
VVEIQQHSVNRNLIVCLESEEVYQATLKKLEKGVSWEKHPGVIIHGYSTSECLTSVTVVNWTQFLNSKTLFDKLEGFGKIISHQFGVFKEAPNIKNGSIHFRMKLNDDAVLPAFIEIPTRGECLQVFSDATEKVCYKCTDKGHIALFCHRKPKKVDYAKNPSPTWACIVQGTRTEEVNVAAGTSTQSSPAIIPPTPPSAPLPTPVLNRLNGKKKKKSGPSGEVPLPEGQRVLDTDDELMDQGDSTPGTNDSAAVERQEKDSQDGATPPGVVGAIENPSQRIDDTSSQESSLSLLPPGQGNPFVETSSQESDESMLPLGQGDPGTLRKRNLSENNVADLPSDSSDLEDLNLAKNRLDKKMKKTKEVDDQAEQEQLWSATRN